MVMSKWILSLISVNSELVGVTGTFHHEKWCVWVRVNAVIFAPDRKLGDTKL